MQICQLALSVLTLPLMACGEQDRMLMFECNPTSEHISIDMRSLPLGTPRQILVNKHQFPLGTILQLTPSAYPMQLGSGNVAYRLALRANSREPDRLDSWFATIPAKYVRLESGAERDGSLWEPMPTLILFEEARRTMLRDPISAINADEEAVATLRNGMPRNRFVVVSVVWLDDYVDIVMAAPPRSLGVNVFKNGRVYWHPTLSCPPLSVRSSEGPNRPERALLFALTAVKYDPKTNSAVMDSDPIDLADFEFQMPIHHAQ